MFLNEMGFPSGSVVKYLPKKQEMPVGSLDVENPLDKEMETHSSIFAWRIPQKEEPCGLNSMGSLRVGQNLATDNTLQSEVWVKEVALYKVDNASSIEGLNRAKV